MSKYNLSKADKEKCLKTFIKPKKKKRGNRRHLEKSFQSEWTRSISSYFAKNKIDYLYEKRHDNVVIASNGQRIRNWYDCFLRYNGKHIAMELKISNAVKTINFKSLFGEKQKHELHYLKKEAVCGFGAWVILNHYCKKGKHNINNVYIIPINKAIELYKKGSVSIEYVKDNSFQIENNKKTWDIEDFLVINHIEFN